MGKLAGRAAAACPECGAAVSARATSCKACGLGMDDPPLPPLPTSSGDSNAYFKVIGGIVGVVVLVLVLALAMGGASTCGECKGKGRVVCTRCTSGQAKCASCRGEGTDPQTFSTCAACKGRGTTGACTACGGNPKIACPSCDGAGSR